MFAIGMLVYAVSEYTIHRFLFHMKPPRNPVLLRLLKRLHYDHHVDPDELTLLFLPVWYSLPLIAASSLVVYAITSQITLTVAFATGIRKLLVRGDPSRHGCTDGYVQG
jgi:4-hydroxysphinganine ceramide fatty acyl 2-hydroxylase